ncbi:MAG: hypothetical protein ACYDC3_11715 [Candidatus Binataceae bacterium]
MKNLVAILTAFVSLLAPRAAMAQFSSPATAYTIITPGRPPSFVNPPFGGGYTVISPGQPPTFISRSFHGGYTVIKPGAPPTFINPANPSYPGRPLLGEEKSGARNQ